MDERVHSRGQVERERSLTRNSNMTKVYGRMVHSLAIYNRESFNEIYKALFILPCGPSTFHCLHLSTVPLPHILP